MSSAEKAKKKQRNQECCKVSEEIKQRAADMEKEIIAERRYFHKHPELSLKETETANALCWRLASMGIEYTRRTWKRYYRDHQRNGARCV